MDGVRSDRQARPCTLAGHYAGATARATVGVDVTANALIGGRLSASLRRIFGEDWRRFTLTLCYSKRATLVCLPRLRVLDCETPR